MPEPSMTPAQVEQLARILKLSGQRKRPQAGKSSPVVTKH